MRNDADATVRVGLVAGSRGLLDQLREKLAEVGNIEVIEESTDYATESDPHGANKFVRARPDLMIVEAQGLVKTTDALTVLRTRLPDTWLLVLSEAKDPMVIIEAVRAGAQEFIPKPLSQQALSQAIDRYKAHRFRDEEVKANGRIYWVTSGKGGTGATSVAINLGASLAKLVSARVIMIDLNRPVGDATPYLNLKNDFTVTDVLAAQDRLDPVLLESYVTSAKGLAIIPGSKDYRSGQVVDVGAIETMLEVAKQAYVHVLVDLPGFHEESALRMMSRVSDDILIVLTPELPAVWRTHRLLSYLESFMERSDLSKKVRLILNRSDSRTELSKADIEKTLEREISWKLSDDYRASIEAINAGAPLVSLNHSTLASDYERLAQGLTGVTQSKRRGFLGLFPS